MPEVTLPATEAVTQPPTQPPTAPAQPPVITKDPTGEKLSPGGKTWFVAHAEGATILTWEFLSPEGTVCSVTDTMTLHPGLLLDISKEDTVALQNVPLSLNGWSARARFDGPGWREVLDRLVPGSSAAVEAEADLFFDHDLPALQAWDFDSAQAARIACPVLLEEDAGAGTDAPPPPTPGAEPFREPRVSGPTTPSTCRPLACW